MSAIVAGRVFGEDSSVDIIGTLQHPVFEIVENLESVYLVEVRG
jgi:hypothetical protein